MSFHSRTSEALGAYVMPGASKDPLSALTQATAAEAIGMGSVWLSELQGPMKDAGAVLGYLGHATSRIRLGTSITHFGTRHPMVLASWGATMQALTGGRFLFGFGRSAAFRWRNWGVRQQNTDVLEDSADILRRLWRGERVTYDGPAGCFPSLDIGEMGAFDPPPLLLAGIGRKSLALAGRAFDGVLLHPFLTPEGVRRSAELVREAAERTGRDPSDVRIYHQTVIAPDLSDEEFDVVVGARMMRYLLRPPMGELLAEMNGWDKDGVERIRATAQRADADNIAVGSPLGRGTVFAAPSRTIPRTWIADSAAIGSADECVRRLREFLDAGVDELILHGTTADRLDEIAARFGR